MRMKNVALATNWNKMGLHFILFQLKFILCQVKYFSVFINYNNPI